MLRNALLAAWILASIGLVAAGACVRFVGPYWPTDQFLHALLFFVAGVMTTVALVCSLPLLRRLPVEIRAGRFVAIGLLAPAAAMVMLLALAVESDDATEARHRGHLLRQARLVADAYGRSGRMPDRLGAASAGVTSVAADLGDADRGPVVYRRLDDRNALLCAPNRRLHVVIRGDRLAVDPWPEGAADPCWSARPSAIGP